MICEICEKECNCLGMHLIRMHGIVDMKKYYDDYIRVEHEGICICGKETTFRGLTKGYLKYCSSKCSNNANEVVTKKKNTTKEHFGNENYRNIEKSRDTRIRLYGKFNSDECCKKISATKQGKTIEELELILEKSRNTRESKYGDWRAPETTDKISNTKNEKYGSAHYNNRIKAVETCLAKYGVTHPSKIFFYNFMKNNESAELVEDNGETVKIKCNICNEISELNRCAVIARDDGILCGFCNPYKEKLPHKSIAEQELADYITSLADNVEYGNRSVLDGKELDIYLPKKKLAFEYDGLYWHSDEFKEKNYHLNKTNECESKNIQLIHIFEDEWLYKRDIVKSRIRGILNLNERIFARKCIIKEVCPSDATKFLNENHIQGTCGSKYRYGLYYNDELVSLMTFGKSRFKDEIELLRFCNKKYTNVIGGASKLFKHFLKEHNIDKIVSYADRRWSVGNLYDKLEFTKTGITPPSYFYIKKFIRENRLSFQKHILVKEGADPNKTESEIMADEGYRKIYDCGTIKYIYEKSTVKDS